MRLHCRPHIYLVFQRPPPDGSRDGVVAIALASHLRGPGSGHEWVKLVVGSLLCSERFFSGFPLSSKLNISKIQFDRMQDLPENHFRVSGASWVNINYYYYYCTVPSLTITSGEKHEQ